MKPIIGIIYHGKSFDIVIRKSPFSILKRLFGRNLDFDYQMSECSVIKSWLKENPKYEYVSSGDFNHIDEINDCLIFQLQELERHWYVGFDVVAVKAQPELDIGVD